MKLISVVGPTAIGKTRFAIALAQHFSTEIISSDSRQFYKEMEIGTAKPSAKELAEVPHHFINHLSIFDDYSIGKYEQEAMQKLELLFQSHKVVVMVGGSPLYEKAVLEGLDTFPKVDSNIREQLNVDLKVQGLGFLQQQLQVLDEAYFQKVDLQNPHRIIRALEICIATGKPYSSFLQKNTIHRNFNIQRIGLSAPREIIYQKINSRVDQMRDDGLLEEARKLYPHKNLNALQTVGYRELFRYLDGEVEEDFAFSEIKKNTRRFAKRQLTWYRNQTNIEWVGSDQIEVFIQNLSH